MDRSSPSPEATTAGSSSIARAAGQVAGDFAGVPRPADATDTPDAAAIAFGADGRLYAGSIAGAVRVIDPNAMAVVGTIQAPPMATNVNLVATRDGLVGSGTDMLVALDTSTGATRWSATIVEPGDPSPCVFLAVTDALGKAYCGNQFGVLAERDLATGQPTGVRLDAQVGSVGDLAITADGAELVGFGRDVPVVARWRLDGQVLIGIGRGPRPARRELRPVRSAAHGRRQRQAARRGPVGPGDRRRRRRTRRHRQSPAVGNPRSARGGLHRRHDRFLRRPRTRPRRPARPGGTGTRPAGQCVGIGVGHARRS